MQVSARALFSYGMELVPGCDKVDPGAANGTMGYIHGTGGLGSAGLHCCC
jgi:hypothetical protein